MNKTKRAKRDNGAGSINYLESTNRWCANIQIGYTEAGTPKRKAIYGKTEAEVKRKLKEFKKEMESKKNFNSSTMTLSEFLERWFIEYKLKKLSKSYYDRLQSVYKYHIKPYIGDIKLSQLTKKHIQKLIDDGNNAGYARASLKKIAEILRPALKVAVNDEHLLDKSPFDGVVIPSESEMQKPTKEIIIYSDRQKEKMLVSIDENFTNTTLCTFRYFPAFLFILNTGLREGELLALKWKHLKQTEYGHTVATIFENITYVHERDADGNAVRRILNTGKLKGKCKKREVPLNDKALKALEQIKQSNEQLGIHSEYIFSKPDGTCSTAGRLIRSLNHLAKLADVPYLGVHSLRHSFASALLKKGVSVKVVAEILGHSDAYFTANVYVHIDNDQKLDAVNSL